MIKYDIHSAYHHISIMESQTGILGFSWQISGQTIDFNFLVLLFGMSCALIYEINKAPDKDMAH